jgi:hypothetical protein
LHPFDEQQDAAMPTLLQTPPRVPTGQIKSFGAFGPKYEIGEPIRALDDGDWMVKIKMVETGEEAEYRYSHLADDPQAR